MPLTIFTAVMGITATPPGRPVCTALCKYGHYFVNMNVHTQDVYRLCEHERAPHQQKTWQMPCDHSGNLAHVL